MAYADPEDQKAAARRHYERNKPAMIARAKAANEVTHKKVTTFLHDLKSKPCLDCGVSYPHYVMQFDHVRGKKMFNIADRHKWTSLARIQGEVEKCEVVCANCHSARTYQRIHA